MRNNLLAILLLAIFSIGLQAKTIKLLTIGNSFSADAVEQELYGLVKAAGDTIIIGNLYIGGASLELHHTNSVNNSAAYSYRKIENGKKTTTDSFTLEDGIKDEKWDYISFQQASPNSGVYHSFFPYITNLKAYVSNLATNPNMEFILHCTWAYAQNSTHKGFANYDENQITMYNAIVETYDKVSKETGIEIIVPVGTAIQNGRTSSLGDTFCRDGYHLERTYGRYTASCTWFEKLFEKSVVGNTYFPAALTPFQAKVAQHAAHEAVVNPKNISSLAYLEDPM